MIDDVGADGGSLAGWSLTIDTPGQIQLSAADYENASGTLAWAAGDGSAKTFSGLIVDDSLDEGNKTVQLLLRSPTGGAVLGTPSSVTLVIANGDPVPAPGPRLWLPLVITPR